VRVRRLMLLVVVVLVGLVGLSGCGTGADRAQVRAVTVRFFSAIGADRGADACMQLSPSLRKTVAQQQSAAGCAEAVGKVKARGSPIEVVYVYATSARVDLAGGASVFLSAMRDGWRIDALGCRPRSSGPFDCEAQG
jgi:ABC-type glycerol-3-phosphate transport system substrate-binding protein